MYVFIAEQIQLFANAQRKNKALKMLLQFIGRS